MFSAWGNLAKKLGKFHRDLPARLDVTTTNHFCSQEFWYWNKINLGEIDFNKSLKNLNFSTSRSQISLELGALTFGSSKAVCELLNFAKCLESSV